MYSNPLTRKYQTGGDISTSEMEEIMQAFYQWLPTAVEDFQGMEPAQVEEAVKGMVKTAKGKKQVEDLLQQFQQVIKSADQESTGMFKQGGKLHDFICKHATGGRVKAGCGCHENGGEIESAEKGTKTKNNYALDGLNFVERYYDPSGNAVYTLAQSRETLPSNMRSNPYSEYSQNGGEYQGDGQVSVVDFGNGRTAINMDPYGVTPGDTFAHGADSIAVLNRLRQIAPKAGIILGPAIREDGGVISAQDGTYLTRGQAFRTAVGQKGLTRDEARHAYWTNKNVLRANGLRGSELRQAARQMLAGQYPALPERESLGLTASTNPGLINYPSEGIIDVLTDKVNADAKSTLGAQMAARYGNGVQQRVQDNWNNQSFDTAFGNARKLGQKTFSWRDRLFGTRLASTPEEKAAWARSRNIKLNPQNTDQDQTATSLVETPATEQSVQERQYTSSRELPLESQIVGLPTDGVYPIMDDYRSNWLLGTRSANTDNNVDNFNNQNSGYAFIGSSPEDSWGTRELERNYQRIAEEQGIKQAQQYARENGYKGAGAALGSTALGIGLASTLGATATGTTAASTPLLTYSGKAAYQAPRMGWQLWRGADGQWIGSVGGQLFRNGSLYYPLVTLKNGGKISWLQNGGLARAKGYYARHANEGIIRKIQNFLMSRGYNVGDLDGKFGQKTYEAIRQYQRDNGLKDDGMWGEDTNQLHRVLGAGETTFNGSHSGAHPGQHTFNEDFKGYRYSNDGKTPTYSDINKIIERGIKDPNWFWGDSSDAKRWRVYFEQMKDGNGQQILETIYNEAPDNLKSKISYNKLPTSLQQKRFNDTTTDTDKAAGIVGATLSAPLTLTNPVATAGAIFGGYAGGNAGEFIGSTLNHPVYDDNGNIVGWRNANEVMYKDTAGNSVPTVKPDKSSEGRDLGTAIGTVLGAAGADAVSNLVEIEPGLYNPTGIELKLGEPTLKPIRTGPKRPYVRKIDWKPTPPKNNFPKTAGGQYTVETPGDLYINETGLNSTLKCGGKVKKAQNGKELTLPENKCGGRIKKGKK